MSLRAPGALYESAISESDSPRSYFLSFSKLFGPSSFYYCISKVVPKDVLPPTTIGLLSLLGVISGKSAPLGYNLTLKAPSLGLSSGSSGSAFDRLIF